MQISAVTSLPNYKLIGVNEILHAKKQLNIHLTIFLFLLKPRTVRNFKSKFLKKVTSPLLLLLPFKIELKHKNVYI